ncbi:MAG: RNA-directed DNA polymerase [Chloroflexota bacterium]
MSRHEAMPKTYKNLHPQIIDIGNLLLAYANARRGKPQTGEMRTFHFKLEQNLWDLHDELDNGSYRPRPYRNFYIYEPKKRLISAAPFRDRIVHHALCHIIQPLFERKFIYDSYANRIDKGTHRALDRAHGWVCRYPYALKADIRKFFPSIDHATLKQALRRTLACPATLQLCHHILDSGASIRQEEYPLQWFPGDDLFTPLQRQRGLPIGNLTSQFWGNVLLNQLDHFVKETLRVPAYLRYVDDFLLFSHSKSELWQQRNQIARFLQTLRLTLHPNKCHVMPTQKRVPFLGFRLFPTHRRLLQDSLRRARRRLRQQRHALAQGELSPEDFRRSLASWIGHVQHGDTYRLRRLLLSTPTWKIGQA